MEKWPKYFTYFSIEFGKIYFPYSQKEPIKVKQLFYSFFILNMELRVVADPESLRCVQKFSDELNPKKTS